jgi:hypothetical protein
MSLSKLVVRFDNLNNLTGGTSATATIRLRKHPNGSQGIQNVAAATITNITASTNPNDGNGPQTAIVLTSSDFNAPTEYSPFERCVMSIQFNTDPTSTTEDFFITSVWRTEMDV